MIMPSNRIGLSKTKTGLPTHDCIPAARPPVYDRKRKQDLGFASPFFDASFNAQTDATGLPLTESIRLFDQIDWVLMEGEVAKTGKLSPVTCSVQQAKAGSSNRMERLTFARLTLNHLQYRDHRLSRLMGSPFRFFQCEVWHSFKYLSIQFSFFCISHSGVPLTPCDSKSCEYTFLDRFRL
jgi:hypothetical protein